MWCFWHTLLWVVDSEFTDWRAIPYVISNIVVITSITILMNIFLERYNNLLYSVLLHFGFNILYVFLDVDIGIFEILTVLFLNKMPIAVFVRNKTAKRFLKNNKVIDDNSKGIVYCYWYTFYCYTVTKLYGTQHSNLNVITRTQRYDL